MLGGKYTTTIEMTSLQRIRVELMSILPIECLVSAYCDEKHGCIATDSDGAGLQRYQGFFSSR
jgi:hypothetical protein